MQQYDEDAQHRGDWRFERAGWLVMALLVLFAAVGGLGGGGIFNRTAVEAPGGTLRIDYPRFLRASLPETLRIDVAAGEAAGPRRWVDAEYLREAVIVEDVVPPPQRVESAGDRLLYEFAASGRSPLGVTLRLRAAHPGRLRARVGLEGGASLELRQLVFP
jgi:hypothetical protein